MFRHEKYRALIDPTFKSTLSWSREKVKTLRLSSNNLECIDSSLTQKKRTNSPDAFASLVLDKKDVKSARLNMPSTDRRTPFWFST